MCQSETPFVAVVVVVVVVYNCLQVPAITLLLALLVMKSKLRNIILAAISFESKSLGRILLWDPTCVWVVLYYGISRGRRIPKIQIQNPRKRSSIVYY